MRDTEKYLNRDGVTGVSGLWSIATDRRTVEGTAEDVERIILLPGGARADYGTFTAESRVGISPEGIVTRDDRVTNTLDETQTVRRCVCRWTLPGGEYEAYTQLSGWEFESEGGWQPLVSKAAAWNRGLRCTEGAAPMLALWNRQTRRGVVWHVFASCAWKLTASVETAGGDATLVVVEAGLNDRDLAYPLAPGETLELPRIVRYEFADKQDLECHRLHAWYLREYPRRDQPVIFNTWMAAFDRLTPEAMEAHARAAADAGAEYFVIDAGWFGNDGRWFENIGDWEENRSGAMLGRMDKVGELVRSLGMKFGLWLEPERALKNVPIVREHPDWFFFNGSEYLTDFSNPAVVEHFTRLTLELIDRYGLEYIKFDFNAGISYDPTGCGFVRWHQGHEAFLANLRAAHPDIWLENCASGGQREEMYTASLYDSCWLSDNHSVFEQVRILKETALRLPPACMERWPVLKDAGGFINYSVSGKLEKLIVSDDAEWANVRGVNPGWLKAFALGGPLGLSFDLTVLSETTLKLVRELSEACRTGRAFWRDASMRILADGRNVTALQYASPDGKELRIAVFVWKHRQQTLTLFPTAEGMGRWQWEDTLLDGETLRREGLTLTLPRAADGLVVTLRRAE